MSSTTSNHHSSRYPVNIINNRTPSVSTMASRGSTYSSSGSYPNSSSSRDASPNVQRETYRSYTSKDYLGNSVRRTSGQRDVIVYNHHSRGYDSNDPHPGYGKEKSEKSSSRASSRR